MQLIRCAMVARSSVTQQAVISSNVLENPVVDLVQTASTHLLSKHIRISTDMHHLHHVASVPPQTTGKGKSGASQPAISGIHPQSQGKMASPPTKQANGIAPRVLRLLLDITPQVDISHSLFSYLLCHISCTVLNSLVFRLQGRESTLSFVLVFPWSTFLHSLLGMD